MSVFDEWVREGQQIPFGSASRFLMELRRPTAPPPMPVKTASVQAGLLKLAAIGAIQEMGVGDEGTQIAAAEKAALTDPNVQEALDYQQAVAEREEFAQAAQMAEQRAAEAEQQAQMAQQQAQEASMQAEQTQQELMMASQEKQDAMMQAIQSRDQSLKEQMVASQKREEIVNAAENLKAQLDEVRAGVEETQAVAAENPVEAMNQQQAMEEQAMGAEPSSPGAAEQAGGPAAKEQAEADNAAAEAETQQAQANQAAATAPPKQQAPQMGGGPGAPVAGAPQVPTPIGAGQPGMGGVAKQGSALTKQEIARFARRAAVRRVSKVKEGVIEKTSMSGKAKALIAGGTTLAGLTGLGTAAGVHRSHEGKRLALEDTGKKLYRLSQSSDVAPNIRRDALIGAKELAKQVREEYGQRAGKPGSWLAPKSRPTVQVEVGRGARIHIGKRKEGSGGEEGGGVANFNCAKERSGGDAVRAALRALIAKHHRESDYTDEFIDNPKPMASPPDRDPKEKVKEGQGALIHQAVSGAMAKAPEMLAKAVERGAAKPNPILGTMAGRKALGTVGGAGVGAVGTGAATGWDPYAMAAGGVGGAAAGRLGAGALQRFVLSPRAQKVLVEKGVQAGKVSERAVAGRAAGKTVAGPGQQVGAEEAKAFESQVRKQMSDRAAASRAASGERAMEAQRAAHLRGETKTAPVKKTVHERIADAKDRIREAVSGGARQAAPAQAAPSPSPVGMVMPARF